MIHRVRHSFILLSLVAALCANAQTVTALPGFNLERLQLDPAAVNSLVVPGGSVMAGGDLRLSLGLGYERDPLLLFRDGERFGAVVGNRAVAFLTGAYGLTDRIELFASIPVLAFQSGDSLEAAGFSSPSAVGLIAPWIGGRMQLLRNGSGSPVDLSAGLRVELPIGSFAALANDAWGVLPEAAVSLPLGPLVASAQLGFWIRNPVTVMGGDVGPELTASAAVSTHRQGWNGEVNGRLDVPFLSGEVAGELLAGARGPVAPGLEVFALAGPGFGHAAGTPEFRVLAGVAYAMSFARKEPAPVAVAPTVPKQGPCDAGQAHAPEQCPQLDDDQDGVLNRVDKCPLVAGVEKDEGCPIPDTDKDGVLDDADQCPQEAGPADNHGCPVKDADQDGVADELDKCPTEAGPVSNQGCPVDTDGDGLADARDNCPTEPGPTSNQGCPVKKKQLVVITAEKIEIKEKVYFASGKAAILPKSFNLLNQVAALLNSHPDLQPVRVEGHTDNTGSADTNRKLSQTRADAVLHYLVQKGHVAAARLNAKGYGPDRPLDTNATAAGREKNRRVEFSLTSEKE